MKVKSKVWLEKNGELIFGEGKSELLKAIEETGSIKKATQKMGISFRHGWGYITAIERRLGFKLIERSRGGRGGGGSRLTPQAKELIQKFDCLKHDIQTCANDTFKRAFPNET